VHRMYLKSAFFVSQRVTVKFCGCYLDVDHIISITWRWLSSNTLKLMQMVYRKWVF